MPERVFSYKPANCNIYDKWGNLLIGVYVNNSPFREPRFRNNYAMRGIRGWEFSEFRKKEIQLQLASKRKSAREQLYEVKNLFNDLLTEGFLTNIVTHKKL